MFLAIILLFAGAVQGDAQAKSKTTSTPVPIQKPASPTPPTPNQSQKVQSKQVKTAAPGAKTSQKARTWQVSVKDSFGVPFITIHAKKAPRSEISAEIARLLKIPVTLGASIRPQQITGDFEDYPLEAVVKLLAPRPFIDYVISGGGDTTRPARKTPIAHTDTEHHSIQRFVLLGRRGRRLQDDNCGADGRQLAGGDGGLLSSDHSIPADFIPCTSPGAGFASSRCDFTTAIGTLRFEAGVTSKTFNVLISQDNYVEGTETLSLTLSNLRGGAVFGVPSTAILSITDDATEGATNRVDDASDFVRSPVS